MNIFFGLLVQALMLFVFLFDPSELNAGASLLTLPDWAVYIAIILGNVTWVLGILLLFVAVIFTFSTYHEGGKNLETIIDEVIKKNKRSSKIMAHISLGVSYVIAIIGVGSGFWFVGLMSICANVSLNEFRRRYWNRIEANRFGGIDDTPTAAQETRDETEFGDLFKDFIDGKVTDVSDED